MIEEFARDMQTRSEQASGLYASTLGKARAMRSGFPAFWRACGGARRRTPSQQSSRLKRPRLPRRWWIGASCRWRSGRSMCGYPRTNGGQWLTLQICSGLPRDAAHLMNVSERMVYSRPYSGAALVGPLGADCDGPVAG
nr:MetaGeneMark_Unknown Function [uncultured bacterium]